eukprot:9986293-Lingulodinium_polyedra.AAC.1
MPLAIPSVGRSDSKGAEVGGYWDAAAWTKTTRTTTTADANAHTQCVFGHTVVKQAKTLRNGTLARTLRRRAHSRARRRS